ncbi:YqhV family protein [Tenuibacillus multivorans]|uniref:DUF2619 domain-containing protein n=1 Tax=Tenuibacillus multivorans TaxID=237069 RepID=A0A1H0CK63_9BACI|nr:YqhV family protein [Tenuibacillus multivorans]GEL76262.1 hypothetical protein TMU01_04970 [Tenuibacillus multivorans]SDN58287.1 Protein of unknown function [Tenuibacillus multivorans]
MFVILEKAVLGMALLRLLSGCIEMFAAFVMLKFNDVEKALIVNSSLALIGPAVLLITTAIGLIGFADQLSLKKLVWVVVGVGFILYGVKS